MESKLIEISPSSVLGRGVIGMLNHRDICIAVQKRGDDLCFLLVKGDLMRSVMVNASEMAYVDIIVGRTALEILEDM